MKSCSIKASIITFPLSQVGWGSGTRNQINCCVKPSQPQAEEVSTQSGLKRYFIFLYDCCDFSFKQKHPSLPLNKKKQYWALELIHQLDQALGRLFFSVIRMILVIRLVQEVKLWPWGEKLISMLNHFHYSTVGTKKKKRALQGYWDICCWSAECMQCKILQIVTTKKNNNKHVKYKTLLKIIVLSMFSLHAALTLLAWAVCFHALCCCVASSRLASCSKS